MPAKTGLPETLKKSPGRARANIAPSGRSLRFLLRPHRGELRIGLQAAFADVEAGILLFLVDADTHDGLQDAPDHQAGDKDPDEDGCSTDQLAAE